MPVVIILVLAAYLIKTGLMAVKGRDPRAYFIPSVSWYKAKLDVNKRHEYKSTSINWYKKH